MDNHSLPLTPELLEIFETRASALLNDDSLTDGQFVAQMRQLLCDLADLRRNCGRSEKSARGLPSC